MSDKPDKSASFFIDHRKHGRDENFRLFLDFRVRINSLRKVFFIYHLSFYHLFPLAIQKYFHNFAAQKAILPIQDSVKQLLHR